MAGDPSSEGLQTGPASGDPTRPHAGGFTVAGQRRILTGLRWTQSHGPGAAADMTLPAAALVVVVRCPLSERGIGKRIRGNLSECPVPSVWL